MKDQRLDEVEPLGPGIFGLYGPVGGGKTVAASTWPGPIRWIDADDGISSVLWAIRAGICPHKPSDIVRFVPRDTLDGSGRVVKATGYWQVVDKINEWLKSIDSWQTLVLDSMGKISEFALTAGYEQTGKIGEGAKGGKQKDAFAVVEIDDYKPAQSGVWQLVNQLHQIAMEYGKYIVLISHEYERKRAPARIGDEPTVLGLLPDFIGQQRNSIPKLMREIYHVRNHSTSRERPDFRFQTVGDGLRIARSRLGCLDPFEPINPQTQGFQAIMKKAREFWNRSG
jgi:hypothetical protein